MSSITGIGNELGLPKVHQSHNYDCGPAALKAVSKFFGISQPENEEDFIKITNATSDKGTTPDELVSAAKKIGLSAKIYQNLSLNQLKEFTDKGIPVICNIQAWGTPSQYSKDKSGHYVVAVGCDDGHVIFEDPSIVNSKRGHMTYKDFLSRWHDREENGEATNRLGIAITKKTTDEGE